MKRIAFIAHLSELSGSGTALVEAAAAMNARDFESHLILPGNGPLVKKAKAVGLDPVIIENSEKAVMSGGLSRKWDTLRSRFPFVRNLRKYFRQHKIDLVCINSSANIFPGIACRLDNVPIVWRIHESLETKDLRARFKTSIIRRWANGLVYDSRTGMENLPHPKEKPGLVARNYIKINELEKLGRRRLFDNATLASPANPIIFTNGTIRRKGADVLLRALIPVFAKISDANISVKISGLPTMQPDFTDELHEIMKHPSLAGKVELCGLHDSLVPLLEQAAIFVSASRNEALPIAIVEAIAAGVPVIATDVGDCADLLENGALGWIVPPENPDALATALTEVLTHPDVAREKAVHAYEKIVRLYGADDFWEPMEKFLNDILNR